MKKVFFGGSFDPPHYGHLGVAKAALASGRCREVVWFPAAEPPHKRYARRASFEHRLNMVKLLIAGHAGMSASDFENRIALSPSYTIDVLGELEKFYGEKFGLLIGADSLLSLHTWHRAEELVKTVEIITYPRINSEVTLEKLQINWDAHIAEKLFASLLPGTFFEISSTEVKNSMEKNSLRHHIIEGAGFPAEIANYIQDNGLYQTGNITKG